MEGNEHSLVPQWLKSSRVAGSQLTSPPSSGVLEKRPTSQTQSRSDFFKNLSKNSSSKNSYFDVSRALHKSESGTSTATSANSLSESSSVITENVIAAAGKPLKFSSNGEQQYSTNLVLHPDEEIAFLIRSLGWEESDGEDRG
ncbi:hypothetical protein PIB30_006314 [Stylosanthes scabra]|uniref:Uncharacterized protein n=1 Tax=Stylosanthes scabra TaxID=79078 RepID=A0ABU6R429_9FABA|nr:hypothetical protein [Stylosanthes scabra]